MKPSSATDYEGALRLARGIVHRVEMGDPIQPMHSEEQLARALIGLASPRSETVTCPLCVPSDDAIEAEIKRLHPHGHYKETPSGMTGQDLLREMARFVLRGVYPLCSRADTSRSAIGLNQPHPSPDASEPMVPTGEYREIHLGAVGTELKARVPEQYKVSSGDKQQGIPFCRVCGSRENEPCPYHTLKSGCPHGVPMVYARSATGRNDVLEEAAKVCDAIQERSRDAFENGVPMERGHPQVKGEHEGSRVCALKIRELKLDGYVNGERKP